MKRAMCGTIPYERKTRQALGDQMTRSLPSGYTVRPATIDDVERAAELTNLCSIDLTGRPATDADELRIDWLLPSSNPETDIRLLFADDGPLAGAGGFERLPLPGGNLLGRLPVSFVDVVPA